MKKLKRLSLPKDAVYTVMDSPVGNLTIIASVAGLHAVLWDNDFKNQQVVEFINKISPSDEESTIIETKKQLNEYFNGTRKQFNLPLVIKGTFFQVAAWQQLLAIPYSKTISYKEQAARIGDKNKARAVGMANGCNAISIIIPCHRVVGAQGNLVGFGGGLDKKAYLLKLEQKNCK